MPPRSQHLYFSVAILSVFFHVASCSNANSAHTQHAKTETQIKVKLDPPTPQPAPNTYAQSDAPDLPQKEPDKTIDISINGAPLSDRTLIASSIQFELIAPDKALFSADDDKGNACIYLLDAGTLREVQVIPNAQIACIDVGVDQFRTATIVRKPSGKSSIVVDAFRIDGSPIEDATWTVTTRGFIPDPGSRCAFFKGTTRKLYATGSRPRGKKGVERGLFIIESNKLSRVMGSEVRIPLIVGTIPSDDSSLIVRRVMRIGDDQHWPHFLYKIEPSKEDDDSYRASAELSADFIVYDRNQRKAVAFNPSQCCYADEALDVAESSIEKDASKSEECSSINEEKCQHITLDYEIADATPICGKKASGCYLYMRNGGDELRIESEGSEHETHSLPAGMRLLPIAFQDDWLTLRLDPENEDRGQLFWGKLTLPD